LQYSEQWTPLKRIRSMRKYIYNVWKSSIHLQITTISNQEDIQIGDYHTRPMRKPSERTNHFRRRLLKEAYCCLGLNVQEYLIRFAQYQQTDGNARHSKGCINICWRTEIQYG